MALGPNINTKRAILTRAEAVIDRIVRTHEGDNLITISSKLMPPNFGVDEWRKLAPKYRKAGWRVATWEFDSRDGDYILLEASK